MSRKWVSDDSLAYGVIVTRLAGGDWWHGHFVRSDLEYDCGLLRRRTTLLFLMTQFGRGASRKSAEFFLTLDGEGVPQELCPIRYCGDWGERSGNEELKQEALRLQEDLVPRLHESAEFQTAMAAIVEHQVYGSVADRRRFLRVPVER